jgi:hypothetical protein
MHHAGALRLWPNRAQATNRRAFITPLVRLPDQNGQVKRIAEAKAVQLARCHLGREQMPAMDGALEAAVWRALARHGRCRGTRMVRAIAMAAGPHYAPDVRAFALVELGDSEAIDLFLREEDARRALEAGLQDEPNWIGTLFVEPIELDERDLSAS